MKWPLVLAALFLTVLRANADDPATSDFAPALLPIDGYVVLFNATGPASYATTTPGTLPVSAVPMGDVYDQACESGISLPLSANLHEKSAKVGGVIGDSGYQRALNNIHDTYPGLAGIYDVKVDLREMRVLTIFSKLCTEISALGFR